MNINKEVKNSVNGYSISRAWFDFAFENQGTVTGNHGCMLMWFLELNNRMGWVQEFGAPREQTMVAIGISSYNTYKKVFNDLVDWGFVKVVKESKNQWTANIIALSNFNNTQYKALDKALIQASECPIKICESNIEGTDTGTIQGTDTGTVAINKPLNKETLNKETKENIKRNISDLGEEFKQPSSWLDNLSMKYTGSTENSLMWIDKFVSQMIGEDKSIMESSDAKSYCFRWIKYSIEKKGSDSLGQIDVTKPVHDGAKNGEMIGKWFWNNGKWRDTTLFTKRQKERNGLA